LVNHEGADIAAANGLVATEIESVGDGSSGIFRVTEVDLITSIGPYYVLQAHGKSADTNGVRGEVTSRYVLISKSMREARYWM
jgi:hypothetical protein